MVWHFIQVHVFHNKNRDTPVFRVFIVDNEYSAGGGSTTEPCCCFYIPFRIPAKVYYKSEDLTREVIGQSHWGRAYIKMQGLHVFQINGLR